MRPYLQDIDVATVDADGLAAINSTAGATLALDGVLTSGGTFTSSDGLGRQLVLLDVGADLQTGATYTFTGTDTDGIAQTEDLAGPGASSSVTTAKYWVTVTSVTIDSPVAGSTSSLGTNGVVCSKTVPLNYRADHAATYAVDVTGTIDYTVAETLDKIHDKTNPSVDSSWFPLSALTAKTADLLAIGTDNVTACRLVVNSYTTGAGIQFTVMQNEAT